MLNFRWKKMIKHTVSELNKLKQHKHANTTNIHTKLHNRETRSLTKHSGQFRVTSYKKGLKNVFFENLGERPIEKY